MSQTKIDDHAEPKYKDPKWLRQKYVGEGLTQREIADRCNVSQSIICQFAKKFEISARSHDWLEGRNNHQWVERVTYSMKSEGHIRAHCAKSGESVNIHRLASVAWFGLEAIEGKEVHHRIPIPWLNVESNLHPLEKQEHMIISGLYDKDGVPDAVVEDVLDDFCE